MDRPPRPAPAVPAIPDRAPLRPPVRARRVRRRVRRGDGPRAGGRRSTRVVPLALEALASLTHRGAIAADAKTGDGAGLADPARPRAGRRSWPPTPASPRPTPRGWPSVPSSCRPTRPPARRPARILDDALAAEGLVVLGWRRVPVDPVRPRTRGGRVRARHPPRARRPPGRHGPGRLRPRPPPRPADRRGVGAAARRARRPSTSPRSRGGRSSTRASSWAPSSAASTATWGAGRSACRTPSSTSATPRTRTRRGPSPSRSGWSPTTARSTPCGATARRCAGARPASAAARWGGASARWRAAGRPLLDPAGSDSTSLDEALELLLAAGWRIDAAVMALLPEALDLRDEAVPGLAAWQAAAVARVEPWDGPAALVFSDGRRVGCVLDRNGLRPAAFEVRRDGLVVCGSEAGMLPAGAGQVIRRGRLGPGELLIVDTVAGRILEDGEAKRAAIAVAPAGPAAAAAGAGGRTATPMPPGCRPRAGRRRRPLAPAPLRPRRRAAPDDREDDGDRRPRADLEHGRRHAAGRDGASPAARRRLPPAGLCPGHEPADRPRAGARGHEPGGAGWAPAAAPRPGRTGRRPAACASRDPVLGTAGRDALLALGRRGPNDTSPGGSSSSTRRGRSDVAASPEGWPTARRTGRPGGRPGPPRGRGDARPRSRGGPPRRERPRAPVRVGRPSRASSPSGAVNAAFVDAGLRDACDLLADAGDAFDVHAVAMLLAAGADAVHPWHAIAVARDHRRLPGQRGARPRAGRGEPARRPGARPAQGAGPDGDQHPCLVPRRPALRGHRPGRRGGRPLLPGRAPDGRCRHPRAARRGGARPSRDGLPAPLATRRRPAARPAVSATAAHPAAVPALLDPGFARFRADGELHAFAPAIVKATQALAAGHPAGVGPGAALAPAVADDAIERPAGGLPRGRRPRRAGDGPRPPGPAAGPARCRWSRSSRPRRSSAASSRRR